MIPNDFKAGAPITQVPASWFNKVASFLNNLVPGYGIKINKECDYPTISLDTSKVATLTSTAPEDVSTTAAAVGTATSAARADHVHKLPDDVLVDDESDPYTKTSDVGDVVEDRIDALNLPNTYAAKAHTHALLDGTLSGFGTAAAKDETDFAGASHTHTHTGITDWDSATSAFLDENDIDVSGGVQSYSAKIDALKEKLDTDGTFSSDTVKDSNCTSGGQCLAYFRADKKLAHLGDSGITVSRANSINDAFTHTESGGVSTAAVLNYKAAGGAAAPTQKKAVGFEANASTASLIDVATVDTEAASVTDGTLMTFKDGEFVEDGNDYAILDDIPQSGSSIATVNEAGEVSGVADIPTAAPSSDKVLMIKKDTTTPTWDDPPPGSTELGTPTDCGSFHTTEVTQTGETLWEVGGDDGATILVLFKGTSSGSYTYLYGAKLTFSKVGILTKIEAVQNCGEKIAG